MVPTPGLAGVVGYLGDVPVRGPAQRFELVLLADVEGRPTRRLAPTSVNRALTAVSALFDFAIVAGEFEGPNPMEKRMDPAYQRAGERHRPFMGSCQPATTPPSNHPGKDGDATAAAAVRRPGRRLVGRAAL